MRKAIALVALGLLLCTATMAATTYTQTIYPNPYGGFGYNWFGLKGVPFNPDPAAIFGGQDLIDNNLYRIAATTGNLEGYYAWNEPGGSFGNMLLGDGYILLADHQYNITFSGVDDGVPDGTGAMTDMWISLPGIPGSTYNQHLIGHPFNHNVPFANVKVTDGTETVDVPTANSKGWIEDNWFYMDGPTGNLMQLDRDTILGSDQMEPGVGYFVITHKNNIALIIPAS